MKSVTVVVLGNQPRAFDWQRKRIAVDQITDHWSETGRWWDNETPCEFFQVLTNAGTYLLCRRVTDNHWYAKPVH